MMDMFGENEKSDFKIESVQVKYEADNEVDASKIDFSSDENIDAASKSFQTMIPLTMNYTHVKPPDMPPRKRERRLDGRKKWRYN